MRGRVILPVISSTTVDDNLNINRSQDVFITGNTVNDNLIIEGTTGSCTGDNTNNTVSGDTNPCP